MGLDINGTRFLLYAKTLGVDYSQSAMIGRQGLHLSPSEFRKNLVELGYSFDEETINSIFKKDNQYAEEFIRCLGAEHIHSFDVSKYEGTTHLHDMNLDIPDDFKEQYSMVLDGGSLEHVFNFPVAIRNCMQMLKLGGHYLGMTPANNFMGHGFYQFSPELYFSIFTIENGFELVDIIAYEDKRRTMDDKRRATWFSVKSPNSVRSRVILMNRFPVYLLIIAKRVTDRPIFESLPQQSDYITTWNRQAESLSHISWKKGLITKIKKHTPPILKSFIKQQLLRQGRPGFNPRFFQRINLKDNTPVKEPQWTLLKSRH